MQHQIASNIDCSNRLVQSVILYNSETWTMKEEHRRSWEYLRWQFSGRFVE